MQHQQRAAKPDQRHAEQAAGAEAGVAPVDPGGGRGLGCADDDDRAALGGGAGGVGAAEVLRRGDIALIGVTQVLIQHDRLGGGGVARVGQAEVLGQSSRRAQGGKGEGEGRGASDAMSGHEAHLALVR